MQLSLHVQKLLNLLYHGMYEVKFSMTIKVCCLYLPNTVVLLVPLAPPNFSQPVIKTSESQSIQVFFKVFLLFVHVMS